MAAALVAVAAGAVAVALTSDGSDPRPERDDLVITPVAPTAARTPARLPLAASAGGAWVAGGNAPVAPPPQHHGAWTGRELVVAGRTELAAFDPTARRWRSLPPPPVPLPHRVRAVAWTGDEVVVLGTDLDTPPGATRGLALDLDTGSWREIAPPPDTGPVSVPAAVWADTELVVWGLEATVAYDPAADRWRTLPRPPLPQRLGGRAAWTGRYLVVWGDAVRLLGRPFAAVYDAGPQTWTLLPDPPLGRMAAAPGVWTGDQLLLVAPRSPQGGSTGGLGHVGGLRLDPDTGRWAPLPPAPGLDEVRASVTALLSVAWTGEEVVVIGGRERAFAALHDPAAGTWTTLPEGLGGRIRPLVAWTGEEVLVWGGHAPEGSRVDVLAWAPPPAAAERAGTCTPRTAGAAWEGCTRP